MRYGKCPDESPTSVINALMDGTPVVTTRHRDLPRPAIYIGANVDTSAVAHALKFSGYELTNDEDGDLWIVVAGAKAEGAK